MKVLIKIPLLLFVLLAYVILALAFPSHLGVLHSPTQEVMEAPPPPPPAAVVEGVPSDITPEVSQETPADKPEVKPTAVADAAPVADPGPKVLFSIELISKASLQVTVKDLLLAVALLLLFFEIFKATRTDMGSILDHMLSTFVFIGYLVAFLVWAPAGTPTFLLLTLISLIDVLCGFSVSIPAARKDIAFGGH
jgi:hypothetical protein